MQTSVAQAMLLLLCCLKLKLVIGLFMHVISDMLLSYNYFILQRILFTLVQINMNWNMCHTKTHTLKTVIDTHIQKLHHTSFGLLVHE